MGRTKTWKALVRALALAGWVWAPAQEPGQERRFVVEPRLVHQTMAGFGAGFNQDAEKLMRTIAAPQDRERAYDLLYGDAGARLSVVRIVVSPDASPLPPGSATRYDWAHDKATQEELPSVRAALTRTKALLYAVPFTPPAGWKDNGLPSKGHLMPAHDQEYADYLADFLGYFQDQGLGIQVLSVQNEPGVAAPWHSCLWSGERLRDFLKVLGGAVRAKGLDTRLMLSEGTSWSGAWSHLGPALADPTSRKLLGVLASHSYGDPLDPARTRFAQAAKATGLPVWTTEMSLMQPPQPDDPGMKAALRVAGYIHRDLTEADAAAWIYCFAIFRSRFQGSMGVLSPSDGDAGGALRVPKRLWAIANYSRFIRPGWKRMEVRDARRGGLGFLSPDGRRFSLVVINPTPQPQMVRYGFDTGRPGALRAYETSQAQDLQEVTSPRVDGRGFVGTVAPESVTTFTGELLP